MCGTPEESGGFLKKLNADDYDDDEEIKKEFCVHEKTFKTRCLLTLPRKVTKNEFISIKPLK